MIRKTMIALATVTTMALGMTAATSTANARVFFSVGVGSGYYGPGYYGPGYYGWHHGHCHWRKVKVWHHHHWVWRSVKTCHRHW
jgi:hypothetical protein